MVYIFLRFISPPLPTILGLGKGGGDLQRFDEEENEHWNMILKLANFFLPFKNLIFIYFLQKSFFSKNFFLYTWSFELYGVCLLIVKHYNLGKKVFLYWGKFWLYNRMKDAFFNWGEGGGGSQVLKRCRVLGLTVSRM